MNFFTKKSKVSIVKEDAETQDDNNSAPRKQRTDSKGSQSSLESEPTVNLPITKPRKLTHHRPIPSNYKICIGDKVKISTINNKLVDEKGTVSYIGYPFPGKPAQYGINLASAKGENDGSLYMDLKTGKVAKKKKKRTKKRVFFKAKRNHGVFVQLQEISAIDRAGPGTASTRFTIEDRVEVRFRGEGRIKFVGNLEHTKEMGVWYGIQLKERKGRHDGTVNGVKYFECAPQYGLHCRQSHLTLRPETGRGKNVQFDDDVITKRMSITDKKQTSKKWEKILGAGEPREMKGFAVKKKCNNKYTSAVNLTAPQHRVDESESEDTSNDFPTILRLVSSQNIGIKQISLQRSQASLSNILPPNVLFHSSPSVNVLPGMHGRSAKSKRNVSTQHTADRSVSSAHPSVKKGGTVAVLPGYEQLKQRKFFDEYDFDEITDQLGEGEFGVVYKCRRIEIEESDDEDPRDMSTTFRTQVSASGTALYPGDMDESVSDSAQFPGDHSDDSMSDDDDEKEEEIFAVKKIKKAKFHHLNHTNKAKAIKLLQDEVRLLEKMQVFKEKKLEGSQYVIDLIDVFEDRNFLYIVTNFCAGGNLWSHIEEAAGIDVEHQHDEDEQADHHHIDNPRMIQKIMKQILEGLAFLHRHEIAHLDLKPDNIMFTKEDEIQLIDFGMSSVIPSLTKMGVLVGTPNFVAPEVIEGFYDKKADVWSCGVILFMLRFGYPPFFDGSSINKSMMNADLKQQATDDDKEEEEEQDVNITANKDLFKLIKKGFNPVTKPGLGPWFPQGVEISDSLKDLITKMLDRDLAKRLTAAECLTHPYFATVADDKKLPPTIMDALTKFSGQCQFKVMISKLFAHQIEPEQMRQLRECWDKFDVDNDGSLTLEQFKKVMNEYDHGYKDYQIEAMFESLDWNDSQQIDFNALLTAFSYQRLVAVDERLWEAFARLDHDNDGHITKAEIKRVLAMVNPAEFADGMEKLDQFQPAGGGVSLPPTASGSGSNLTVDVPGNNNKMTASQRRLKNISIWIGECMIQADWDDDGQIDYEEFLRALHPRFNEEPVTPKALATPSKEMEPKKFIFQPSLGTGVNFASNGNGNGNGNKQSETNANGYQIYRNKRNDDEQGVALSINENADDHDEQLQPPTSLQSTKSEEITPKANNAHNMNGFHYDNGSNNTARLPRPNQIEYAASR